MTDEPITPVIFRADKRDGDVTAVFPTDPADYTGECMGCYAHVGQHSQCSLAWYHSHTRPATPAEYADLKAELEAAPYGYRLAVYKRITREHRNAYRAELRRIQARA
jgi:hypothetical protein